ncbi:MAG: entericidin A/B family lipoprotein [Pseudomonadota bacterium]|nr:entericidin A/B family lipoprotein [Pseudomonadota bacterium]
MTPKKLIIIGAVKLAVLVVVFGVVYSMYGCNTVRGVGQDIQKAGEKVGGAIERAGNK